MSSLHELYMERCFNLAEKAGKHTGRNPRVGAVLVYKDRIIGEGYHKKYGSPHAEVNCLENVSPEDKTLIDKSTLYVSLEPCCHFGKTPPCTSLISDAGIPRVVISSMDPSEKVSGKGVSLLRNQGVEIITGILENKGNQLIRPFSIHQKEERPYIILKIVKSKDNYIGKKGEKIWLTNTYTDVLTHKWRSEADGIMAGTETVIQDQPSLTTRNFPGDNPMKVLIDRNHRIPSDNPTLSGNDRLIYFTISKRSDLKNVNQKLMPHEGDLNYVLEECYKEGINYLLVEGGSELIKSFRDKNLWDEARVISTPRLLHEGIPSVNIKGFLIDQLSLMDNDIKFIFRQIS